MTRLFVSRAAADMLQVHPKECGAKVCEPVHYLPAEEATDR